MAIYGLMGGEISGSLGQSERLSPQMWDTAWAEREEMDTFSGFGQKVTGRLTKAPESPALVASRARSAAILKKHTKRLYLIGALMFVGLGISFWLIHKGTK